MTNSCNGPIFVVGIQRSGTTLLAAMLDAHPRLGCGPETHFFRRLSQILPDRLCDNETWPMPAVEFICSIKHTNYVGDKDNYLLEKYKLTRADIEEYLSDKEPSIPNVLASVTESYMLASGKTRWVEKTPDHYKYVKVIRDYFPKSPIIRIIRDPRDVALSLTRLPWGAQSYLEALIFWKAQYEESEDFFQSDECCYTLRYEDLVISPTEELQKLCAFIGEEYFENMQDTSSSGLRINSRNVPWKQKVGQPIDTSRVYAWRADLTSQQNQFAEAFLGNYLEIFDYPRLVTFNRLGTFYPNVELAIKYATGLERQSLNGIRFWKQSHDEPPKARIFLGDPGEDHWFSGGKWKTNKQTLAIVLQILRSRLSREDIIWVTGASANKWSGMRSWMLKRLLTTKH